MAAAGTSSVPLEVHPASPSAPSPLPLLRPGDAALSFSGHASAPSEVAGSLDDAAAIDAARFSSGGSDVPALLVERGSIDYVRLVFDHLSSYGRLDLFRALPPGWRGRAFPHLRSSEQSIVFDESNVPECERLLGALAPLQRSEALISMTQGAVEKVLHLLTAAEKAATAMQRIFKEGTVGSIMHHVPPRVVVERAMSVGEALRGAGAGDGAESPATAPAAGGGGGGGGPPTAPLGFPSSQLFVRDDFNKLLGAVDLRALLSMAPSAPIEGATFPVALVLRTGDATEELLRQFTVADVGLVPVVDDDGKLLGVVRPRDAMKLLNKRLEQALAASDTGITSYSKAPWHLLVRKRIFWLFVLALLNFGVAAVVAQFEDTIARNLVLAGFIPLLAGMGGNIGAQSSGLVIAAVSGRDISPKDIWRVLRKELAVGGALSAILAAIVAVMGYIRANEGSKAEIAGTLGISMGVIALVSNLLGVVFPFAALRCGQDPAVSSSPLITTVIDVAGISIYLGLARVILGI